MANTKAITNTENVEMQSEEALIKAAAAALGRKGGLVGGKARAASLTPKRRTEIAKKAAAARWGAKD
jgi:hypothetical protein